PGLPGRRRSAGPGLRPDDRPRPLGRRVARRPRSPSRAVRADRGGGAALPALLPVRLGQPVPAVGPAGLPRFLRSRRPRLRPPHPRGATRRLGRPGVARDDPWWLPALTGVSPSHRSLDRRGRAAPTARTRAGGGPAAGLTATFRENVARAPFAGAAWRRGSHPGRDRAGRPA